MKRMKEEKEEATEAIIKENTDYFSLVYILSNFLSSRILFIRSQVKSKYQHKHLFILRESMVMVLIMILIFV